LVVIHVNNGAALNPKTFKTHQDRSRKFILAKIRLATLCRICH